MNTITRFLLLAILSTPILFAETEQEKEAVKKAFPWIFADDAFRYQTVSVEEISAYCRKHEGEMSIWYEEYKKRFGEFKEVEIPEAQRRPENGMMSGIPLMIRIYTTFYINKRASEGWKIVGASGDFFIFERPGDIKTQKNPDSP